MKRQIKNLTQLVLFEAEAESDKQLLEKAVSEGANLGGANLGGAYLRGAYLEGAYLEGANLRGANLEGANLRGANLEGANLEGANLGGAYLRGANLRGAYGLERFPLQIGGHKHWLITQQDGELSIGCHKGTFDWWLEHADTIGRKEDYSALDIEIYKLHIAHLQKVSQLLWAKATA